MDKTAIHQQAISRFRQIQSTVYDERKQCLEDRRFYSIAGAQWEGALSEQFANKPKFEVNKIHLAIIRIFNEYRNNRITADFIPRANGDDELADTCDGLFRSDEIDSGAEEAYDNAFEEAVGGGIGAIRLRAVYEDEEDPDNDKQRIRIEPVYDADSTVFFDLDAKRQDKKDANYCFVLSFVTIDRYKELYEDDPVTWPKEITNSEFDWVTDEQVVVAEYYVVEKKTDWSLVFTSIMGTDKRVLKSYLNDNPDALNELLSTGYTEQPDRKKKISVRKVHKYILSGGGVLEDCGYIAGKNIPIVPVYGKRWIVDGLERCMGHVRLAKDAQRIKNMQLSKLGELSALSGVEKPIFTPEQVIGHQLMWAEDNIKNYPYLLVNPITGADGSTNVAGAVGYTKAPAIAPAMAALIQLSEQDMLDILGNPQATDKLVSNVAGQTVEMIQDRMDMQTFIYVSNFAKAVRRIGEIWLSMAQDVYVEEGRVMKIIDSANKKTDIALFEPMFDKTTTRLTYKNDLSKANFDVVVDVGPSTMSKRKSAVRSLIQLAAVAQEPEIIKVLSSMIMMNMEGEGINDAREFYRKQLVSIGVLKPTMLEQEEMQKLAAARDQQPDPSTVLANAMAEEAHAKAAKARVDAIETISEIEKTRAQTLKILSEIREQALMTAKSLAGSLKIDEQLIKPSLDEGA